MQNLQGMPGAKTKSNNDFFVVDLTLDSKIKKIQIL